MRVLICDDHTLIRAGLRRLIESFDGIEVVAEAAGADEAVIRAGEALPDVVLLDLSMPGRNGFEALDERIELGHHHPGMAADALRLADRQVEQRPGRGAHDLGVVHVHGRVAHEHRRGTEGIGTSARSEAQCSSVSQATATTFPVEPSALTCVSTLMLYGSL